MIKGVVIVDFIEKVLDLRVTRQPWEHLPKMPYYIQDWFIIEKATLGKIGTLFLYPKTELDHTTALQKHIARIQKEEALLVVIALPSMS